MFGIGLYEIKVPTLDQRIKVSYLAHCVATVHCAVFCGKVFCSLCVAAVCGYDNGVVCEGD